MQMCLMDIQLPRAALTAVMLVSTQVLLQFHVGGIRLPDAYFVSSA